MNTFEQERRRFGYLACLVIFIGSDNIWHVCTKPATHADATHFCESDNIYGIQEVSA